MGTELNAFLPPGCTGATASGVDAQGNIAGTTVRLLQRIELQVEVLVGGGHAGIAEVHTGKAGASQNLQ